MKERHFSYARVVELKHSELRRKKRHQEAVLECLRELVHRPNAVRIALAHKRFALTAKVVDHVIEPVAHLAGLQMDRSGALLGAAQMLFYVLQTDGSYALSRLLSTFQALARNKTAAALKEFLRFLDEKQTHALVDEALDLVRGPAHFLGPRLLEILPDNALELSLTAALRCVCVWRAEQLSPLQIVHDDSQNMQKQAHVWDWITSPTAPRAAVGYGAHLIEFPLGVEVTTFRQSHESAALQLADILAGSICQWTIWMNSGMSESDWYGCRLHEVFVGVPESFFAWWFFPSTKLEMVASPTYRETSLEYLTQRLKQLDRTDP